LIENNKNLVNGSPRELWESAGMRIEEEYHPKKAGNEESDGEHIYGRAMSGIVPSAILRPVDISNLMS
jgi:hypothetical protein